MQQILLEIGPFKLYSYGLALVTAFYVDYYILQREFKRLKYDPNLATDIVFWAAVGGILGAKIYYLVENIGAVIADPAAVILSGYGLVFWGGLVGGTLGVTFVIWRKKLEWLVIADIVAPLLIMGYAIGRTGCFMNGCCYGLATDLPWGLHFPHQAAGLTVHPTQLYEFSAGLIIFYILWQRRKNIKFTGNLFFTYFILAGSERFLIEFIRINPKYVAGLSGAQIFSILLIAAGTYFLKNPIGREYRNNRK